MKTVRLLFSCLTISAIATTVSAAGICIVGNGGCQDLSTSQVYVRSGDELVDPVTGQAVMTIEKFKAHVLTEQDRRDTLRYEAEAIAKANANAKMQRIEAANQRARSAQAQAQSGADGNSLPIGVSSSYFDTNGQYYQGVAGGIVNSTNGTFLQDVGAGFVNSRTGAFTPK